MLLIMLNNSLLLFSQHCHIGDVVTNPSDGVQGVVFYVNTEGTGGWMVALNDQSSGCPWGTSGDIPDLPNCPNNNVSLMWQETNGKENTRKIREYQQNNSSYAAGMVDFEHGWYVPAIGQLRILYSNLAVIEASLTAHGGTILSREKEYWSSSEVNEGSAFTIKPDFLVAGTTNLYGGGTFYPRAKTYNSVSLRAICDFSIIQWSNGAIADSIVVSPSSTTTYSVTATVGGICPFSEELEVTVYDLPSITIEADEEEICEGESTTLHAVIQRASIGDILCTDGSFLHPDEWSSSDGKTAKGIIFYVDGTGTHGWALGLNDMGNAKWCNSNSLVAGLTNYTDPRDVLYDVDGYANTQKIRAAGDMSQFPAAYLVSFSQGWYLPAVGQWRQLYAHLYTINASLQTVNGTPLSVAAEWYYWSSSQYNAEKKWELDSMGNATIYKGNTDARVRAVCSF